MMIAAIVGAMLMSAIPGITAEARGQSSLTQLWSLRVVPFVNAEEDEGVAMGRWLDGDDTHIFVTGWGTNSFGGVCIVTYRIRAADGTIDHGPVYFPPDNFATQTLTHKPTAMIVDGNGDVYITGYSQNGRGDYDYILLKYDNELRSAAQFTGWAAVSPDPAGVRRFNGEGEDNDKAVSVVLVQCPGSPPTDLVVITGASRGEDNDDIVTVAYNRDNGDLEWQDAYNGPGDGHDSAVKMVTLLVTEMDDHVGQNIFIGGTVWSAGDLGFDITALRYTPCGSRVWVMDPPYNNPLVNGDDICTGVAALGAASGASVGLFLSGSTPHYPASQGNTDYVTLGIQINNGSLSSQWQSNGHGDGVRIWNPSNEDGASDDVPTDVTLAGFNIVVTGRVGNSETTGGPYDVGTIAYSGANGVEIDSLVYGEGGKDGIDVRAVNIFGATEGTTPIVYVTGWYHTPFGDTPFYYMTLKYTIDPMVIDASAFLTGDGFDAKARKVLHVHDGHSSGVGVYVTGRHGVLTSGVDHLTVKYSP